MDIALMGNTLLRLAIRENLVSFPSQVPALLRRGRAETMERVVQLYFLRGWSVRNICARYKLSKAGVQKLLSEWRVRAIAAGYIQGIDPDALEIMARQYEERARNENAEDSGDSDEIAEELVLDSGGSVWAPAPPAHGDRALATAGGL